jgi:hypothetical protein
VLKEDIMLPQSLINELPHDYGIAIQTTISNHPNAYRIMDIFPHNGICLSLNTTAYNLRTLINSVGISAKKLHIIDPLAKVIESTLEAENTTHIPYNLNHMLEAVKQTLGRLSLKERFVIVDAVHALPLTYDKEKTIAFLRALDNTIKIAHAKGIYLYDKEQLPEPIQKELHKMVDKVIQMN